MLAGAPEDASMPAIIPIPALRDNYVWLVREGAHAAVVDPGDAAPVLAYLESERLALTGIVITHHHWDHVNGIAALAARFPVPVFGPAHESIPGRTNPVTEGDAFTLPQVGLELSVLDVPGHTSGQVSYFGNCGGNPVVFTGDTLFTCGCGRIFEGTPAQMLSSLAKLAALPADTLVYCGHEYTIANLRFALAVEPGNAALHERQRREVAKRDRDLPTVPSRIDEERATNPFLRAAEPAVFAAAQAHAGRPLADTVDAFATLREWKNNF
jgi:hydroxyacylglutathione hydrolase